MTITGGLLRCLARSDPGGHDDGVRYGHSAIGRIGAAQFTAGRHERRRVVGGTVYEDAKGRRHEVIPCAV
jgi:hypothetical protein